MNLYSTVDGIFAARWIHTDALSAINIAMPLSYLTSALSMVFGSGGAAPAFTTAIVRLTA